MRKKFLGVGLALALLGSCGLARADSRSDLTTLNNQNINANGQGKITGPVLNGVLGQMINSFGVMGDTNEWSGANTFDVNPAFPACVGYPFSSGSSALSCSTTIPGSGLAPGAAATNGGVPHVASLTALQSYPTTYGNYVHRDGYTTAGDGGGANYFYSSSSCSLASGAGDGGSQVQALAGGCWNWSPPAGGVAPIIFGAKGTANTLGNSAPDDSAAINAALAATGLAGIPLIFDTEHLYKITSPINMLTPANMQGNYRPGGAWNLKTCSWGIVNYATNINAINLSATTGTINAVCIDMSGVEASQPTSGAAINIAPPSLTAYQSGVVVTNNGLVNVYDGIDVNGFGQTNVCCGAGTTADGNTISYNTIHYIAGTGISNGKLTSGASTPGNTYWDNIINCSSNTGLTPVKGTGFAVYDGGVDYNGSTNGPEGCNIGFLVAPGLAGGNQQIAQVVGKGVLGDQSITHDFVIQPTGNGTNGGVVLFLQMDGAWAGSTGTEVPAYINCTNVGSACSDIQFNDFIVHGGGGNTGPVMDIEGGASGPFNLSITGSDICQFGTPGSGSVGLKLNAGTGGTGRWTVTGNRIGEACGPGASPNAVGIAITIASGSSANGAMTITGNDLSMPNTPITYTGTNADRLVIGLNQGIDEQVGSIADAASITTLPSFNVFAITGTGTTITAIANGWNNRAVKLVPTSGSITFATGGAAGQGICSNNGQTLTQYLMVTATYNSGNGCWFIH